AALGHVYDSLRPGGMFAFWENNPWNPGTRYCMRVNPFDRDALPITPFQARRLLHRAGFAMLQTTYVFFFPRFLRGMRLLESRLSRLPLGGQYLVLARKPQLRPGGHCQRQRARSPDQSRQEANR
ncbi:MAG: hypothetical protein ACREHD_29175, partial [Pirellulales bacterium]